VSIFNWKRKPEVKTQQFEQVLMQIIAARQGIVGSVVTPDSALASPTVKAIDTAISRRLSVTPIHVYQRGMEDGHETKKKLPDHPLAQLLRKPNEWQTASDFWMDAASVWTRHGNFYAYKSQTGSGKTVALIPLPPPTVEPKLEDNKRFHYIVDEGGQKVEYAQNKILHARQRGKNFYKGDSPVEEIQTAIMMEILAEKFGESFFRNGAVPMQIFKYMDGFRPFADAQSEEKFVEDFKEAFSGSKRFNAMLLPHGIETSDGGSVENDKAQFIESRKYQRTVIAGGFGVPPHLVGDLERATFNNVEQQDKDFTMGVVLPVAKSFESALERDLLTDEDRNSGIIVRFNLDSILRADFKSRQEGLQMQRLMGVINSNEWREIEGMNPREGGDEYYEQGPSGQGMNDAQADSDNTP
jgi:HK97 family phage portal protein